MPRIKNLVVATSLGLDPIHNEEDWLWMIQEEKELEELRFGYAHNAPHLSEEGFSLGD